VDVASCSGADLQSTAKPAVESVRIVSPAWQGDGDELSRPYDGTWGTYKIKFNLSVANDGDKKVTSVDVMILLYDEQGKQMLHAIKRTLRTNVDPNLAERQEFEVKELKFNTYPARTWRLAFRVLSFTTE
jgi:hypothetical protein